MNIQLDKYILSSTDFEDMPVMDETDLYKALVFDGGIQGASVILADIENSVAAAFSNRAAKNARYISSQTHTGAKSIFDMFFSEIKSEECPKDDDIMINVYCQSQLPN